MIRVRTLGDCTIEVGESRIGPDSMVLFGLLLYLAMERGRPVPRGRVRELFWPGVSESKASHSLRQLLYRTRQLGIEIEASYGHLTLDATSIEADFAEFESGRWSDKLANGGSSTHAGRFLDGYTPRFSEPFLEWVEERRAVVHGQVRHALLGEIASCRTKGAWSTIDRLARQVLSIDPFNEEATLSLAEATALMGSKVEAVAMLDRYASELGEPTARRLDLPTSVLRRRIAERLPDAPSARPMEGPFVGRTDSMRFLSIAMAQAKSGRGASCHITGTAGIGKTRLVEEFSRAAIIEGLRVERMNCRWFDRDRPMSAFAELVPNLLKLPGALGCSPTSLELLGRFSIQQRTEPNAAARPGDAEFLAAHVRSAVLDLLDAVSGERALVVVVEDLHVADERSRSLLAEISQWVQERPLMLVCTSREALVAPFGLFTSHRLAPLASPDLVVLIESLLQSGRTQVGPADTQRLVQLSEGNPFYARELVGQWLETRTMSILPPTLSTLIDRRLSDLTPEAMLALQTIVLLDRDASLHRLEAVLEYPRHLLVTALQELETAGLVGSDSSAIGCTHDLIAEASTARMSPLAARSLHRSIALAQERASAHMESSSILWDCARHWDLAGEPARAVDFGIRCAEHLLMLGLASDAARLLERIQPFCQGSDRLGDVLGARAVAHYQAVDWPGVRASLLEKRDLVAGAGSVTRVHDAEELMLIEATWRCDLGSYQEVIAQARSCIRCEEASVAHRLAAGVECLKMAGNICDAHLTLSLYADLKDICATNAREHFLRAQVEMIFHSVFGDVGLGAAAAVSLVRHLRANATPAALWVGLVNATFPLFFAGRTAEAASSLLEAREIAHRFRLGAPLFSVHDDLVLLSLLSDDFNGAERWHAEAAQYLGEVSPILRVAFQITGIEIALGQGRLTDAVDAMNLLEGEQIPETFLRGAAHLLAVRLGVQLASDPAHVSAADVDRLLSFHVRLRAHGAHDRCAVVLFSALHAQGKTRIAKTLYQDYTTLYRRERTAMAKGLKMLGRSLLGAEEERGRFASGQESGGASGGREAPFG